MRAKLLEILQYSEHDYDMLALDLFYCWCMEHCYNIKHLQTLVGNRKLYQWFMREYTKRERFFYDMAKCSTKNTKELRDLYDTVITTINNYPKALLHEISKTIKKGGIKATHTAVQCHLN